MNDNILILDLFKKKLTPFEISEVLGLDIENVIFSLKESGIKNPKYRKYEIIRKNQLTDLQIGAAIGCLLGNGNITSTSKGFYRLTIKEKDKNKIFWKKTLFSNIVNVINNENNFYYFHTANVNNFSYLKKIAYNNTKKIITEELLEKMQHISLVIWIMDKGFMKGPSLRLSTHNYTLQENELIKKYIKLNFLINCKVCKYIKNEKEYYYISFNKNNTLKLNEILNKYYEDALYKRLFFSSTTTCQTPPTKADEDIV